MFSWASRALQESIGSRSEQQSRYRKDSASSFDSTIRVGSVASQHNSDEDSVGDIVTCPDAARGSVWRSIFGYTDNATREGSGHSETSGNSREREDERSSDDYWNRFDLPSDQFRKQYLSGGSSGGEWERPGKQGAKEKEDQAKAASDKSLTNKFGNILHRPMKADATVEANSKALHEYDKADIDPNHGKQPWERGEA